ncbi:hypothetical protein B2J93_7017 [Marssonina coronariae]|uniref:Uncharacterized protein n=1 Tax=Diplocarpon coronariae TaxID=2795749 RepID=A0A218YW00_9HELO|nr:hypothetical protein B2J93_7017 [Marssonina coronariae]
MSRAPGLSRPPYHERRSAVPLPYRTAPLLSLPKAARQPASQPARSSRPLCSARLGSREDLALRPPQTPSLLFLLSYYHHPTTNHQPPPPPSFPPPNLHSSPASPTSIIPPTSIDCLLASALPFCTSSSIPPSSAHRICLPSPWRWSFENLVLPRLALARPAGRESARTPSPRSPLPKSSTSDALYKVPRDAVHILGKGSSLVVIASGAVGHLALPLALVSSPPYRSGSRAPKARHTLARN